MPIVNRLKNSPLRSLQRRRSFSGRGKNIIPYIVVVLTSALSCTYLELLFTGLGFYSFPQRPFPQLFPIDIRFTLIGVPVVTSLVLFALTILEKQARIVFLFVTSFIMMVGEMISDNIGLLVHSPQWSHAFSFFGYMLFFMMIWTIFKWTARKTS
ncbi:CBO0543 family protein [Pseudalkalibacillus salsuginis]|uniref:CBO0543 family protein n=1 Tax=Pseudalkalibacillus salsuginis TaxID=2910972 RepID=UPI00389A5F69